MNVCDPCKDQANSAREWVKHPGSQAYICVSYCGILNRYRCVHESVCVCAHNDQCSSRSGATALRAYMLRCKQLWMLGSSVWAQLLAGPTLYVCVYIHILPSWLARNKSTMRPLVSFVFMWALSLPVCVDLCGWQCSYMSCTCVCMCLGIHAQPL